MKYLSQIKGFKNREAAELFLDKVKNRKKVASSIEVYQNIYDKFVDPALKGVFTRYYHNSKN